jgi:hypothetical protein
LEPDADFPPDFPPDMFDDISFLGDEKEKLYAGLRLAPVHFIFQPILLTSRPRDAYQS